MEDELDPDTYGDDFSESGHYASASNDQEDDEQHAQKVSLLRGISIFFFSVRHCTAEILWNDSDCNDI